VSCTVNGVGTGTETLAFSLGWQPDACGCLVHVDGSGSIG
jgi:hypothetical protein